jgi:hypothetical protein
MRFVILLGFYMDHTAFWIAWSCGVWYNKDAQKFCANKDEASFKNGPCPAQGSVFLEKPIFPIRVVTIKTPKSFVRTKMRRLLKMGLALLRVRLF